MELRGPLHVIWQINNKSSEKYALNTFSILNMEKHDFLLISFTSKHMTSYCVDVNANAYV